MTQENQPDSRHGYVFNIQRYSLHDGPGIRTLVFLKGCPLRCMWCSNPESQRVEPELAFNRRKCIGVKECGFCVKECPDGAIHEAEDGLVRIDREACGKCFRCVEACPAKALTLFGKLMSVDEVLHVVETDGIFYARSGGGLTLSGGEPLVQADFVVELLKEAKKRRIDTSMETCGLVDWKDLERACRHLDSILYDIKSMDPVKHKEFTGASNERVIENFLRLCEAFPDLPKRVRTPVVPGFNDTEEEIGAILDFIQGKPNVEYEPLAYHRLGQPKYEYLDREYPLGDVKLDQQKMKELERMANARMGVVVKEDEPRRRQAMLDAACGCCDCY